MKSIFSLKMMMFFGAFVFLLSSCTTDGTTGFTNNPVVNLVSGTNIVSGDATVLPNEVFTVNLTGSKGDNALKSITIKEDGTNIVVDRLTFTGDINGGTNPTTLLSSALQSSFNVQIAIAAHSDISTKVYSFIVADDQGNTTSKTINITTSGTAPKIEVPNGDFSFSSATSTLLAIGFKVSKGTSKIKSVEVLKDGVSVTDLTTLFYDELTTPFTSNPYNVPTADQDLLDKDIIIKMPSTAGVYKYTFKFTDESGLSSSVLFTSTVNPAATAIMGVLFNQSGVAGTGGLDLDTGKGTGSAAAESEIRDEGNIGGTGSNNYDWKQQVSGINNSVVKYIKPGQNGVSENFKFENITMSLEVAALFANGVDFTQTISGRKVSDKLNVGDMLIVQNGSKNYLVIIKEINVTSGTDNKDNYKVDIKY